MEEFFLKFAALLEEFYFLLWMLVLVLGVNASANVMRAIYERKSSSHDDSSEPKALPEHQANDSIQDQLDRIEKALKDRDITV